MVHLLIVGDTGTGDNNQRKVATIMEEQMTSETEACILLGDNFYETGTKGISDEQFRDKFEEIYKRMAIAFWAILGNHDWGNHEESDGRHMSQVEYSKHSKKWNMPSRYYHHVFGNCDFFMLDTNFEWMEAHDIQEQYNTMIDLIKASKQRWKIICGHHTWRSVGGHGNAGTKLDAFLQDLVQNCGTRIHLYMCGHDHCKNVIDLQISKGPTKSLKCVVIGTGSKPFSDKYLNLKNAGESSNSYLHFHSPNLGFCDFRSDSKKIHLDFYGLAKDGSCVKEYECDVS
jgi:tartrate-resistant acid phosphatase type 5